MTIAQPTLGVLSDDEQQIMTQLYGLLMSRRATMLYKNAYYEGEMRIANMGIAVPANLRNLRTIVGWARLVVDSLDERLDIEGFRGAADLDTDADLWDIWQANDLDTEAQIGRIDAMVYGSSYLCVGANDDGDTPIITAETPLHLTALYDARLKNITAALRVWSNDPLLPANVVTANQATLYLPDETVSLTRDASSAGWQVIDRDQHDLGVVPVVRMTNRERLSDRYGRSEITPELVSVIDAACRSLLSLSIAGEFYSTPQRYILGASEQAFQNADGTPKTGWETYIGRYLALERNESDELPSVGQFTAYDPTAYTKVIDEYAQIVGSITGVPAEYLGITTANPQSADAIRMTTDRLVTKAKRKQRAFQGAYEKALQLAVTIRDGDLDPAFSTIETLWRDPAVPTPAATSDAITKQVATGILPATSDIALQRLGYSLTERQIIRAERAQDAGAQFLAELATSLQAKEARVDKGLAADFSSQSASEPTTPSGTPAPATPPATPPAK